MKVNVQVATLFEATPFIRLLQLERKRLPGLSHYYENTSHELSLWISGIGVSALTGTLPKVIQYLKAESCVPDYWINFGIAGCNTPKIAIGACFQVAMMRRGAEGIHKTADSIELFRHRPKNFQTSEFEVIHPAHLFTYDQPVFSATPPQPNPVSPGDNTNVLPVLFDMEAYHWASMLTDDYQIPLAKLASFKVVSDHATRGKINFRKFAPLYDATTEQLLKHLSFF